MRMLSLVGARPQFIKLAPVSKALRERHEEVIVHTGQHYDYGLSEQFFIELGIPMPDYNLEVGSALHGEQTARILSALEPVLRKVRPDWVIVFGDTNSTLAGALAAAKLQIPVAHIEAGMRSFNREMPEEINRVVTDHLSTRLYCSTLRAQQYLALEGIVRGVEVVGDVTYDLLLQVRSRLAERLATLLPTLAVESKQYFLATVHRPANTDGPEPLRAIIQAFNRVDMPVIFPIHPRTRKLLNDYDIVLAEHVHLLEPIGYIDMLALLQGACRVMTDSGGLQKEAFLLRVPCVTLREETEWAETVESGWNVLVGAHTEEILAALLRPEPALPTYEPFGEGNAAELIAQSL